MKCFLYAILSRVNVENPFLALPHEPFSKHKELFSAQKEVPILWRPTHHNTNLSRMMKKMGCKSVADFHHWSVEHKETFWKESLAQLQIQAPEPVLGGSAEYPSWFSGWKFSVVDMCFRPPKDKVAILTSSEDSSTPRKITYGELRALVNKVANGLLGMGLKAGTRIDMPMIWESVAIYLGIISAGCVVVSIADSFTAQEVHRRVEISETKIVFTVDSFVRAGKIIDMYSKIKEAQVPRAIVLGGKDLREDDLEFESFLGSENFISYAHTGSTLTNILFSSGTTGDPKMIPWTQFTPLKAVVDGFYHQDIQTTDVVCWPTNVGWMMGPWLIYATFLNQATMALFSGAPTLSSFGQFVQDAKVSILGTVPSIVKVWRQSGCMEKYSWDLKCFSSTGECSNPEDYLYLMWLCKYKTPIIEYCGGTEIGGGFISGTLEQPVSPSTFTTPCFGIDVRILREDGTPCDEGETGEAFLLPPSLGLSETLQNADHHQVYYEGCPNGLRRHGDALERLPQGFYRHHGRVDDTMNLGAIKVSSAEIETLVNRHPAVYESAAISVSEKGGGVDLLVLYVVLRERGAQRLREDLQERIKNELNPLFRISDLVIAESLPRTASNKVMRRVLRKEYLSH
jgi:acetyl-CoA synthetase